MSNKQNELFENTHSIRNHRDGSFHSVVANLQPGEIATKAVMIHGNITLDEFATVSQQARERLRSNLNSACRQAQVFHAKNSGTQAQYEIETGEFISVKRRMYVVAVVRRMGADPGDNDL